ncbi:MAG: SpoIIE family protein phosphatase [Treponema sp.]|nr:SpoIIE family protein phosphatase [Treponema sp.]
MKKRLLLCSLMLILTCGTAVFAQQKLYWDEPRVITSRELDCRFPSVVSGRTKKSPVSAAFWEEIDSENKQIYISASCTTTGNSWTAGKRFAGPFEYSGTVPEIFSAAETDNGKIAVAVLSDTNEISVYTSTNGQDYKHSALPRTELPLVGPRIFATSGGNFVLFATLGQSESLSLVYATSRNGEDWSSFSPFAFSYPGASNPLVPYVAPAGGGDMMVFQAHYSSGGRYTFQIFSSVSYDNGKTWSAPKLLTSDGNNNQRPVIIQHNKEIHIAWEQSQYTGINSSIRAGVLSSDGSMKSMESSPISIQGGNCIHPEMTVYNDRLYMIWSDRQSTESKVYIAQKQELFWDDPSVLIENTSASTYPVTSNRGKELSFVWQQGISRGSIAMLFKDLHANPPRIIPQNFTDGKGGTVDKVFAAVEESSDSSGIRGFSFIYTQDPDEEPEEDINTYPLENKLEGNAPEDGLWYFKAKQVDYAGNWSRTATVTYRKDTTAPLKPLIHMPEIDENGLLKKNTFTISWDPSPEDTDVAGYTWSLQYIDSIPQGLAVNSRHPLRLSPEKIEEIKSSLIEKNESKIEGLKQPPRYMKGEKDERKDSFTNKRNGLYLFTVAAIDEVGNISQEETALLFLNKYIPQTYLTAINAVPDVFGDIDTEIYGGGYTYEGTISAIYIDSDGKAPYDRILTAKNGDFTVASDNRITGIKLTKMDSGNYYIGLLHTDRGLYMTKDAILAVKDFGTVKPYKEYNFIPGWLSELLGTKRRVDITLIIVAVVLVLAAFIVVIATRGLSKTAREAMTIKAEVKALIEGGIMPEEKKSKQKTINRKGVSLRVRLVVYTMTLILALVVALALTLGYIMIRREERTRAQGLEEKVHVILDALSSGAKINLPNASSNLLALSDITEESLSLSDANYATITGNSETVSDTHLDYIWATNDPAIASKIDTQGFTFGISRLQSPFMQDAEEKCLALNERAEKEINVMAEQISELTAEGLSLAGLTDEESIVRRTEISEVTTQLSNRVDNLLSEMAKETIGSYPQFSTETLDKKNTEYIFYKPVLYLRNNEQTYVHGIVFVEVSTEALIQEISIAQETIIRTAAIVVAIGLILGFIFSFIISLIIVRPIIKLSNHVAMIRDTEDKESLAGKDIIIKSKDEIGMLGDTVNEMTHGLVDAAVQSKNLTFGKEVQTRFIPLQTDGKGNTLTYGSLDTAGANFFSYYAGADDLSGDYFDYKQIDNDHYIIIKCDVSGHGVPAALIMVEVAALFLNAFSNWSMKNPNQGTKLGPVVGQINDLIESRGFKGRFAAFTLCLMNTKTGDCWFCNAGDSLVQIYDGTERRKKTVELPKTPAAGMFSTDLINMKGGYKVVKLRLKKDDVLLLYTDGIEEAKRNFRDINGRIFACSEPGLKEGDEHGNHKVGESSEELGPERITEIVESVFNRGTYTLKKWHDPNPLEEYTFDFSNCRGTAEEAIMAMVSVEKVFRMYRTKEISAADKVKVDKKIDDFLKVHFKDYSTYCLNHMTVEGDATHLYYQELKEDVQYDDLTLIAIKKN